LWLEIGELRYALIYTGPETALGVETLNC